MNNIFGYLCWRGDLSLSQSDFNEVDNLVLSTLCYLDFEEIVPRKGEGMYHDTTSRQSILFHPWVA